MGNEYKKDNKGLSDGSMKKDGKNKTANTAKGNMKGTQAPGKAMKVKKVELSHVEPKGVKVAYHSDSKMSECSTKVNMDKDGADGY